MESISLYEEMIIVSPFIDKRQLNELKKVIENWEQEKKFSLKILTTTFDGRMKYLDLEGLRDFINFVKSRYPNMEIKLKIEDARLDKQKKLHAKAYLFRDGTKSSQVIYSGSSNFTYAGMNTSKEWNIKLLQSREPEICQEVDQNFNLLWNDQQTMYDFTENSELQEKLLDYKKSMKESYSAVERSLKKVDSLLQSYPHPDNWAKKNKFYSSKPKGMKKNLFLQYANLNNSYLIDSFIEIIEEKRLTADEVVNNLFIASFVGGELNLRSRKALKNFLTQNNYDNLESVIFDPKYSDVFDQIKKLLEDKHQEDSYHYNNNKNLENTFFTYHQCKALALHASYKQLDGWNLWRSSGVEVSKNSNSKIALFTDEKNKNSRYGYNDKYHPESGLFKWYAPNTWKSRNPDNKINQWIKNGEKETLIFHKTEYLKSLFTKNEPQVYYEYLGVVKPEDERWIRDNQKIINFSFA